MLVGAATVLYPRLLPSSGDASRDITEFGDRIDLENQTRQLMARMERDRQTELEWGGSHPLQHRTPACPGLARASEYGYCKGLCGRFCSLLLRVSVMPAQLDVDPNHRPVNINAIVPNAPVRRLAFG